MKTHSTFKTFFLPLIITLALFSILGLTYKHYNPITTETVASSQDSIILNNVSKIIITDTIAIIHYKPIKIVKDSTTLK